MEEVKVAIPWPLWFIWKNRNSNIYAHTQNALSVVVHQSLEESLLWHEVNKKVDEVQVHIPNYLGLEQRWQAPVAGTTKCNLNSNWINASSLSGGAWVARDETGSVLFHARDAFTCSPNRITSELRCVIWALKSLQDLHVSDVVIGLDCRAAFEAINKPYAWPRYRVFLTQINTLVSGFQCCTFELESVKANSIARHIAASVIRDGRFTSYLSVGGPAWLHDLIAREAS